MERSAAQNREFVGPVYSTLRKRYATAELIRMRFTSDGSRMVKRGACRRELATATSLDGRIWRVTPIVRGWMF